MWDLALDCLFCARIPIRAPRYHNDSRASRFFPPSHLNLRKVLPRLFKEAGVGYCKVMQRAVIRVEGMDCEDCARAIARLLEETPGVSTAEISLDRSQAVVELAPPADTTRIIVAIQNEGYGARVLR